MSFDARGFLTDLRAEVETHPAVNHTFLARVGTSPFSREDYKIFGMQHYPLVGMFTGYMERLLINAPNSTAKCWLAKVLVDEYGEGSDGHDHAEMYRMFLTACGVAPAEEDRVPLHSAVVGFIRTHLELCSHRPFLVGLGALGPGHEWAIPRMFVPIIAGLRRARFEEDEISYFTLHCLQDQDHALWLEEALASMLTSQAEADQVREGALASLEARRKFWEGVQSEVVAWRQPARPMDLPERARMWLSGHHHWLGRISPQLAGRTAVYRPQARALADQISIR
jgi:pyrroloquinoline quinone (PQQ) biosynthesis protein C